MTKHKLIFSLLVICLLVTPFSFVYAFEEDISNTAHGTVTTDYSFTYNGTTYNGTASQYISDSLYNVLYNQMTTSDSLSGFSGNTLSYTIYSYSPQSGDDTFSIGMNALTDILGNDLWRTTATLYVDEDFSTIDIYYPGNNSVYGYFNTVDFDTVSTSLFRYTLSGSSTASVGSSIYTTTALYDYGNFRSTTNNWDPDYKCAFPFYSALKWNSGSTDRMYYIFPVYPTSALTSSGSFDFSGLRTYVYDGESYVFIPVIYVYTRTSVACRVYAQIYKMTLSQFEGYLNTAGLYSYYTTSEFNYNDGSDVDPDIDYTNLLHQIIANQETIIDNQEQHTTLFHTIINKLDSIISSLSQLLSNNEGTPEDEQKVDDVNQSMEQTGTDIDQLDDIESDYTSDFDSNFENNTDLDIVDNTIETQSNGIEWLAGRLQDVYNASGNFQPIFILPLVYGFVRVFLGV